MDVADLQYVDYMVHKVQKINRKAWPSLNEITEFCLWRLLICSISAGEKV